MDRLEKDPVRNMKMEIDILKETINVLKKTPASAREPRKAGKKQ